MLCVKKGEKYAHVAANRTATHHCNQATVAARKWPANALPRAIAYCQIRKSL
jgi:hypothetical protein